MLGSACWEAPVLAASSIPPPRVASGPSSQHAVPPPPQPTPIAAPAAPRLRRDRRRDCAAAAAAAADRPRANLRKPSYSTLGPPFHWGMHPSLMAFPLRLPGLAYLLQPPCDPRGAPAQYLSTAVLRVGSSRATHSPCGSVPRHSAHTQRVRKVPVLARHPPALARTSPAPHVVTAADGRLGFSWSAVAGSHHWLVLPFSSLSRCRGWQGQTAAACHAESDASPQSPRPALTSVVQMRTASPLHDRLAHRTWAAEQVAKDPTYFSRLQAQQAPEYLWIGCADSRVPVCRRVWIHTQVNTCSPAQLASQPLLVLPPPSFPSPAPTGAVCNPDNITTATPPFLPPLLACPPSNPLTCCSNYWRQPHPPRLSYPSSPPLLAFLPRLPLASLLRIPGPPVLTTVCQ
eukprot:363807-Chlamydomonas_euryale.AAC.8